MKMFLISDIAKLTNTTIDAVRFYEKKGLLKPVYKAENQYRYYDQSSLARLRFIKNCRNLDLSITEIIQLLSEIEQPNKNCESVDRLIEKHLEDISVKIKELKNFQKDLKDIRSSCKETDQISSCTIIKNLCERTPKTRQ